MFPSARVPGSLLVSVAAGERFQSSGRFRNVWLRGHERGASEHPGHPEKLVGGRRGGTLDQGLQPVQALPGLEGKEISGAEWIGHAS